MNDEKHLPTVEKMFTGIEGLDHITGGGLLKARTTMISGSSGAGKTLLSLNILYRRIEQWDDTCIFVSMEESIEDIIINCHSLGWDLNSLVEQEKLFFIDASPLLTPVKAIGEANLDGLLLQIETLVKTTGASLVSLDSIGGLFSQFSKTTHIRKCINNILHALKNMGITSMMTVERLEEYGPISRHGIEEFVSDNVIILRNVLKNERTRRTIQIFKMRGTAHETGEFPFTISDNGVEILPLSARELKQSSSSKRISSGNKALDEMADGGLFKDSIILVSGPTGGGKTLLGTTFAAEGCRNGERVLILAYEESQPQLRRNAQAWGFDFDEWERAGQLKTVCLYPETLSLDQHLVTIHRLVVEFKPDRLVIDSISAMERIADIRTFREFVIGLTSFCKQMEVCSLFTATTPRLSGGDSVTEAHISTITDIIVILRYVEVDAHMRRGIAVVKMRGSQHDKRIREFTIDGTGLHLGEPFKHIQNIILGTPSATNTSEIDKLESIFKNKGNADV